MQIAWLFPLNAYISFLFLSPRFTREIEHRHLITKEKKKNWKKGWTESVTMVWNAFQSAVAATTQMTTVCFCEKVEREVLL